MPRKLLEQVGGFDENFSMPGGGYANLDLFERLAQAPGVTPASILGEGTFHQFHGGTTTNVADETARRERVVSYRRHFEELRGRRLVSGDRPLHYVGAWPPGPPGGPGPAAGRRSPSTPCASPPTWRRRPSPVPDEVKLAAIESVWDHQAWRDATWLGHPVNRYPADLHVYQELLAKLRPDLVVLAGEDGGLGGRALYVASICDQLGPRAGRRRRRRRRVRAAEPPAHLLRGGRAGEPGRRRRGGERWRRSRPTRW